MEVHVKIPYSIYFRMVIYICIYIYMCVCVYLFNIHPVSCCFFRHVFLDPQSQSWFRSRFGSLELRRRLNLSARGSARAQVATLPVGVAVGERKPLLVGTKIPGRRVLKMVQLCPCSDWLKFRPSVWCFLISSHFQVNCHVLPRNEFIVFQNNWFSQHHLAVCWRQKDLFSASPKAMKMFLQVLTGPEKNKYTWWFQNGKPQSTRNSSHFVSVDNNLLNRRCSALKCSDILTTLGYPRIPVARVWSCFYQSWCPPSYKLVYKPHYCT